MGIARSRVFGFLPDRMQLCCEHPDSHRARRLASGPVRCSGRKSSLLPTQRTDGCETAAARCLGPQDSARRRSSMPSSGHCVLGALFEPGVSVPAPSSVVRSGRFMSSNSMRWICIRNHNLQLRLLVQWACQGAAGRTLACVGGGGVPPCCSARPDAAVSFVHILCTSPGPIGAFRGL